ncbi:MAG: stage V sporulation protein AD [Firmicutes bacterium]|nr:stage V sporulation protein AD [Bacillota bacterium]
MERGMEALGPGTYRLYGVGIATTAAVVGPKEGRGPLGGYFDRVWPDDEHGQATFEAAELALATEAATVAVERAGLEWEQVEAVLGGDLLDQLITTNFAGRAHGRPLLGVFAACASFTEALGLGACLIAGGGPRTVLAMAASHHYAAERQFRFPTELGYQRLPTASWTATAAGATVLTADVPPGGLIVEAVTFGRVVDYGQKNPNDMGSAMAPAAADTILRHLQATGQRPGDFDRIVTGDLGAVGVPLAAEAARRSGTEIAPVLDDCGLLLYDRDDEDVHNGGSGAGCSAAVFNAYLATRLLGGSWRHLLLAATGALFSPTTYRQGESIPGICHAVEIRRG